MKGYIKALWAQKAQDEISELRAENADKDEEIARLQSLIVSTQCQWTDEVQKLEYDNKELSLQRIDLWSDIGELEEKNAELRELVVQAWINDPESMCWNQWSAQHPILKEQP